MWRFTPETWAFTAPGIPCCKAAEILSNENTGLVFVGDGANRESLGRRPQFNQCSIRAFRPVEQVPHVMMAGDVQVITVKRGLKGVVVPSKLYSTLAAGRPVLVVAVPESDAARIVTAAGCGLSADPDDPAAVAAAIRELRATLRAWPKWAAVHGKPRKIMLELTS